MPTFNTLATTSQPLLHLPEFWLPESPVHDEETGVTYFTDIPAKSVYSFELAKGMESLKKIEVDEFVGCLFQIAGDKDHLLAAAKTGLAKLDLKTGKLEHLVKYFDTPEKQAHFRANDGAVDPWGRVWIGVMRSFNLGPPEFEGTLFLYDLGNLSSPQVLKHPVGGPNGIAFSPDKTRAYFADTKAATIYVFALDPETGEVKGEAKEWIVFNDEREKYGPGNPDGLAVSEEGDLWVAMFNGDKVIRVDPGTKEVKGEVSVKDSRQVACPRFVGEGLVVTTGKLVHMDPKVAEECKYAGDVFYVPLEGVKGRAIGKVKLP